VGWLRLVGSLKLYVSLENIGLFWRAFLQKRPIILRSLLIVATQCNGLGPRLTGEVYCNTLQHTATHCNTLHTATHCNALQHTTTHCNTLQHIRHYTAIYGNTLQHIAIHRNILQHTAKHCNALQRTLIRGSTQQHTAIHCKILQHIAARCNTLQHTSWQKGDL